MTDIAWSAPGTPLSAVDLEVLVVGDESQLGALEGRLGPVLAAARGAKFTGKDGSSFAWTSVRTDGTLRHHLLLGAGRDPATSNASAAIRLVGFRAAKHAVGLRLSTVGIDLCASDLGAATDRNAAISARDQAQLLTVGIALGQYRYTEFLKSERESQVSLSRVEVTGIDAESAGDGAARGAAIAAGICTARDLANGPANLVTPSHVAEQAKVMVDAAKKLGREVSIQILEREDCEKLGMGAYLGVAQGSAQPPKLVHCTYKPANAKSRLCLVGKGVTFDSGGYSLKPSEGMMGMKLDMHGAATVLGAFQAIAALELPIEVHAITALTENMIGPAAYRLGDVLTASNGKTIEINNTDAEGRLTLADALVYACKLKPAAVIDFATLTGACVIALGPHAAGLMSPDEELSARLLQSANLAGEQLWRLPVPEDLSFMLESKIADLRNTGERAGGALTAGLFLKRFVDKDVAWAHVDIAGPAMCTRPFDVHPEGGTGYGVASAVQLATSMSDAS